MNLERQVKVLLAFLFALLLMTPVIWMEMGKSSVALAQGGTTVFTNVRITHQVRLQPRDFISVTMNGTVNPTGSYQKLSSAGTVATSGASINVEPAGTFLVLHNVGSGSITFTETGTLISAGNIVLGENDTATLISDGTNYTEISRSNN